MDFFKKYLATIKSQLATLTISQKLLVGLLVVVMAATIYIIVLTSAKPEMVVLMPQSMSVEDINRAEMYLKGKYDYQISGDKILVPADKAYSIRGEMFSAQALPRNTTAAFDALVRETNVFKSESATSREWTVAKSDALAAMLREFPYLDNASVIIAQGERSGLGRDAIPSSATVSVKTRSGDSLTSQQVVAIVSMMQGAIAGIKAQDIHITDGMRRYQAPSDDAPMPSDILEYKHSIEDDFTRKLNTMFDEMGEVKIAVNATPDLSVRNQTKETYDPKGVVKAVTDETSNDTSTSEGGPGGEPGVKPNVAAVATDSSGPKSLSTTNQTTEKTDVRFGKITETAILPAGTEIKDLTASISIPRSYFVSIYRRIAKDPKADPEDDKLQPTIDAQLKRTQLAAMNAIGAKSENQIRVDWFDDTIVSHPAEIAQAGYASGSVPVMVTQYAKQGVLAVFALGVLGMMLMMVRRSVPATDDASADPSVFFGGPGGKNRRKAEPGQIDVGDDVYGEANSGEAVLTGIELDDDTLQSRKMVDEVSIMIKENPENAATLVKRWMNKTK